MSGCQTCGGFGYKHDPAAHGTDEPACTCDEGREFVCHQLGTEPHYAGCPRWGTPLATARESPADRDHGSAGQL